MRKTIKYLKIDLKYGIQVNARIYVPLLLFAELWEKRTAVISSSDCERP